RTSLIMRSTPLGLIVSRLACAIAGTTSAVTKTARRTDLFISTSHNWIFPAWPNFNRQDESVIPPVAFLLRTEALYSRLCGFCPADLPETFDQQVEHRDEKQVENRAHDHPAEYRRADGMTPIFSSSAGRNQRHDTQNERERSHENRPQADACRLDRRLEDRHA